MQPQDWYSNSTIYRRLTMIIRSRSTC